MPTNDWADSAKNGQFVADMARSYSLSNGLATPLPPRFNTWV